MRHSISLGKGAEGCRDLPALRPVCIVCFFQSSLALRINSYSKLRKILNNFAFPFDFRQHYSIISWLSLFLALWQTVQWLVSPLPAADVAALFSHGLDISSLVALQRKRLSDIIAYASGGMTLTLLACPGWIMSAQSFLCGLAGVLLAGSFPGTCLFPDPSANGAVPQTHCLPVQAGLSLPSFPASCRSVCLG